MNQIGMELRDAGIERAFENAGDWRDDALLALKRYCAISREFCTEDFRLWWLTRGGYHPHTHHAWAGLFRTAEASGLVKPTGQFVMAKSPKTHAHRVRVYRSCERVT